MSPRHVTDLSALKHKQKMLPISPSTNLASNQPASHISNQPSNHSTIRVHPPTHPLTHPPTTHLGTNCIHTETYIPKRGYVGFQGGFPTLPSYILSFWVYRWQCGYNLCPIGLTRPPAHLSIHPSIPPPIYPPNYTTTQPIKHLTN